MDGYSYAERIEMQEADPMLTDSNRDTNEYSDKHKIEQVDLTEVLF